MKNVAFLRAINVGGRNVKKEQLQESFRSLGFRNVLTVKQSGNIIFETENADVEAIRTRIEEELREALGFDVATFIRTRERLKAIIKANPFGGCDGENGSFMVTFLPEPLIVPFELPLTIPKSTARIISATGAEIFSVTHGGGEGGLPNSFLEGKLKVKATTRNLNVVKEIAEKL